jgi:hypothetical protein
MSITINITDGGREEAGFKGQTGDCVVRAIAIASGIDYQTVYDEIAERNKRAGGKRSARDGTHRKVFRPYLQELGFKWTPVMGIGTGTTMHLREDEVPGGTIICSLSRHIVAVIDGVVHDTFDPSRGGTRAVYGYWEKED